MKVSTRDVIAPAKALRQEGLVDLAMRLQRVDDGERHLRVVGVSPGRLGQSALADDKLRHVWMQEEALAKGIANREAIQRD